MEELEKLYQLVASRKECPEEGSYTSYLLEKGAEKILKKVGEESTEVVLAAMKRDSEELVMEISDLLYHLVVLMAEQGITWQQVNDELAKRAQKTGNRKAERREVTQL